MALEAARITVATLFNSVWEAAVLAFAVWLVLRLLPNLNATTRYIAWCCALAASLLLPLLTALPKVSVEAATLTQTQTHAVAPVSPEFARVRASAVQATTRATTTAPVQSTSAAPSFRLPQVPRFALPSIAANALFGVWALLALVFLVRLALNLRRLEGLKSDALPLPVDYREHLERWTRAEKGGRDVRLCVSEAIDVPVAVGLFDSMILIPSHLLETLTPEEMDQVMLHELGHLRRADDWTNGLQRIIQALFFFNPAVLFIAQQLDLEREVACDDWVLAETKNVRPYARCLTKMAEVTAWPHRPLAAPGVFVTRRGLSLRVERLLRAGRDVRTNLSLGAAGTITATIVALFFVVQTVAPSYAFTQQQQPATAQSTNARKQVAWLATPAPKSNTRIIYVQRDSNAPSTPGASTSTESRTIVIPATHVHVPAQTIHIPAMNVDVKEQHFSVPVHVNVPRIHVDVPSVKVDTSNVHVNVPRVHVDVPAMHIADNFNPLPPNFAQNIARQVEDGIRKSGYGGDYSGQNLSGHDFHGQHLSGADFSRANLQNVNFSGTRLAGADFSNANVRGANFSGAQMIGCDFSNADAAGARFDGVTVTGCDFSRANLDPGQAANILRGCSRGCDLTGMNFNGANLRGVNVTGIDLERTDLSGADLSGSTFTGVDFTNARMDGARLSGATFVNCSFDGVDKSGVDFSSARVIVREKGDGN